MYLLSTVTILFCISTALSLSDIKDNAETTTNEIDNSVGNHDTENIYARTYGNSKNYMDNNGIQNDMNELPTPAPSFPKNELPMPTTGCFGHLPSEHNINNGDKVDQQQFGGPQYPHKQVIEPIAPQFNQGHMRRPMYHSMQGPDSTQQFYPHNMHPHPFYPPQSPWRRNMPFVGPQQFYPQNPWSPWRRNMPFVAPPQFYPQNQWSPWRHQMPFIGSPMAPQFFPQNGGNRPPVVIVKLLQPIILPVAKPFYPEGGDRDPDSEDVDTQKYVNGGFQKYLKGGYHRYGGPRRFGNEQFRTYEKTMRMPFRENNPNTFGPYKVNGENIHISVKLH